MMRIIGVIPSRYASTRFPGKPLRLIKGKSLIRRVWEQSKKSRYLDDVIVATDDKRIADEVRSFGGTVVMTSRNCKSGTDRLAEVAWKYERSAGIILNIQGDEPLIHPGLIDRIARELARDRRLMIATAVFPLKRQKDIDNPNIAKVVIDKDGFAVYFSRSPIPFNRGRGSVRYFKHIGIYGYRRDFLLKYAKWLQTPLEKAEKLEQLRVIESGEKIMTVIADKDSPGVDVPDDIRKIEKLIK
ncbi:MAG: 3-deoxy-manno-octulosonate cytidylyltransferase [Elusimicrobiota bacterium]